MKPSENPSHQAISIMGPLLIFCAKCQMCLFYFGKKMS